MALMNKLLVMILCASTCLLLASCEQRSDSAETERQLQELSEQLEELKALVQQQHPKEEQDTSGNFSPAVPTPSKPEPQPMVKEQPPRPRIEKEEVPEVIPVQTEDTVRHYYTNGSISVKISPWSEFRQTITLYDLYGRVTFETENIRQSYSVSNDLKFHANGAVSTIVEHMNPGASLYMYKSTMTFSTTNDPQVKRNEKWPSSLDEISKERPWFWNKQSKQWVQQEIVIETNWPEGD
jgi:hypothetical protein